MYLSELGVLLTFNETEPAPARYLIDGRRSNKSLPLQTVFYCGRHI